MATRRDIREAFVTELNNAVPSSGSSGHVTSDNITIERPESDEDIPSLVYDDLYRDVPFNQASTGPHRVERDQNDDVTGEFYKKVVEAQFNVLFWFASEDDKEACYEAVRTHFEKFEIQSVWPASDIHADVERVMVQGASSEDDADIDPVRHGDRLPIHVIFVREYEDTRGEPIDQVDHEVDADNDGTTDATWTTT